MLLTSIPLLFACTMNRVLHGYYIHDIVYTWHEEHMGRNIFSERDIVLFCSISCCFFVVSTCFCMAVAGKVTRAVELKTTMKYVCIVPHWLNIPLAGREHWKCKRDRNGKGVVVANQANLFPFCNLFQSLGIHIDIIPPFRVCERMHLE